MTNYTTGIFKQKPFLMPYCKPDDWRLQVHMPAMNYLSLYIYVTGHEKIGLMCTQNLTTLLDFKLC